MRIYELQFEKGQSSQSTASLSKSGDEGQKTEQTPWQLL